MLRCAMVVRSLHRWSVSPRRAIALQRELAPQVSRERDSGLAARPRLIAGGDLAFSPDGEQCIAAVVVWDAEQQRVVEQVIARRPLRFPYIPGLLSFREGPALIAALRRLKTSPEVMLFDGQGLAHPRRLGLASHVGLWLGCPTIGCAKSRLVGQADEPGQRRGTWTALHDGQEVIGAVLRTRDNVRPLYVSIGHRVDLPTAIDLTLACCTRYRLPEPTRLADRLVAAARKTSQRHGTCGT